MPEPQTIGPDDLVDYRWGDTLTPEARGYLRGQIEQSWAGDPTRADYTIEDGIDDGQLYLLWLRS